MRRKYEFAPEVIFLSQISENVTSRVFCAVIFAHFNGLNIADDFYEVVLQDVAFTFPSSINPISEGCT